MMLKSQHQSVVHLHPEAMLVRHPSRMLAPTQHPSTMNEHYRWNIFMEMVNKEEIILFLGVEYTGQTMKFYVRHILIVLRIVSIAEFEEWSNETLI